MGSEEKMDGDDSKWVEALNHGDSSAFEQLFAKYYSRLSRFAYRYVQSETVAESLTQEVFVNVWKQRDQLDPGRNIRSFLYQSVRNEALDYIEHKKIVRDKLSRLKVTRDTVTHPENSSLDKQKFWSLVQEQIENLPPKTRRIYKLSRKDGLTYNEIADVLDISPKTVEYHITKALEMLRQELENSLSALYL
ncbi:RNA polymerase sigma-70 factor, ECF subfamily [Fodinibius roseus]|uniref:RNA polymerase sigma-70 factor, ECF subfamily n=1 Tax=Fodinibius roseus TaxID=1194090 RepID=A0A1M4V3A9_9BACT|nr:RNA polymerase sigma-70 factor [Fodinibius roseus]SHE63435.1 RNA polymerase sigma-70 factor, ECF subfamily [Fodinibius roseus]